MVVAKRVAWRRKTPDETWHLNQKFVQKQKYEVPLLLLRGATQKYYIVVREYDGGIFRECALKMNWQRHDCMKTLSHNLPSFNLSTNGEKENLNATDRRERDGT